LGFVEVEEREGMALRLMEHESGQSRGARLSEGRRWSESELDRLAVWAARLSEGEPLQHVLGQAWFDGMALRVTPDVLIPRPETEELAAWMAVKLSEVTHAAPQALDWCTGSGCIALSLKKRVPRAKVHAWDVSRAALDVAQANAEAFGLDMTTGESDLLSAPRPSAPFHLVVSNPPYIPAAERKDMHVRVVDHEPALALFVPDEDPLLFFRALVRWCEAGGLSEEGWLGMECHHAFAGDVAALLADSGRWKHVEILEDLQGKPRHVVARLEVPSLHGRPPKD
jgi:release factor glutamine methyltransferase